MVDVAIIGGGPAGVAAALALRARGIKNVAIVEREAALGGVPRHCGHPPFGLREFGRVLSGAAYARRLAAAAEKSGVQILLRHSVTALRPGGVLEVATPEGVRALRAVRVLLATGARETPRAARFMGGDRPAGVLNTGALQAHIYLHNNVPFTRPVVVGTELVGLSALATCRRHGVRPVAVLEPGKRPTARWPLGLFPRLLGIPLLFGTEIAEIRGGAQVEGVVLRDGRQLACDGVLLTGSFLPEASLVRAAHLALDVGSNGPAVDQYGRCSDGAYFAAGNVLRAVESAGWSFAEGIAMGDFIADDLCAGLPSAEGYVAVTLGAGLDYVVPQRLVRVTPLRGVLQLRADVALRGQLRVRAGGLVLYRRHVSALPHRRILLDLNSFCLPHDATEIVVEFVA